jgi:hypothetical protein
MKKRGDKRIDFYVRFQKYGSLDSRNKGTQITSQKFASKKEAEANFFLCRYNGESSASQKMVDKYIRQLLNEETSPEKPAVVSTIKKTAAVRKKARFSWSKAMTGAPHERNSRDALPALNPMLPGPFNKYNSVVPHDSTRQYFSAWKIVRHWKRSKNRRADARSEKVLKEQNEHRRLIHDFKKKITDNNWIELLEGTSPGSELELCATPNDVSRAIMQAKAVCRALKILHYSVETNKHITWSKSQLSKRQCPGGQ